MIDVSLLVRLWVEITQATVMYGAQDSQPPCEAVSWNTLPPFHYHYHPCQPPCEAVSWNMEKVRGYTADRIVSLLVRLWVEIHLKVLYMVIQLSASLWGCELKYILGCVAGYVIIGQPPCEAVSWNVHHGRTQNKHVCQPPCEAVSWNTSKMNVTHKKLSVSLLVRLWVEIKL